MLDETKVTDDWPDVDDHQSYLEIFDHYVQDKILPARGQGYWEVHIRPTGQSRLILK